MKKKNLFFGVGVCFLVIFLKKNLFCIFCIFAPLYFCEFKPFAKFANIKGSQILRVLQYQCYVYRTDIRHIPPEVAWDVIRRVWYDECDTMSVIRCKFDGGKKCWLFFGVFEKKNWIFILNFLFWIFFLNFFFWIFFLNFFFEICFPYFFFLNFFLPHVTQSIVHCLLRLATQADGNL